MSRSLMSYSPRMTRALVLGLDEGPVRVQQRVGLGRLGHGDAGRQADAARLALDAVFAAVQIGRDAGALAAPVQDRRAATCASGC